MRGFSGHWPVVLSGAIDEARAVLRDLDDREIPAGLGRVASYQGGRLPPPLAARLLKELDQNDWFRAKVAEVWNGEPADPADLFLNRAPGWWVELAAINEAADAGNESRRVVETEARLEQVEAKRAAAARKVKEYRKLADEAKKSAKRLAESARRAAEQRYSAELDGLSAVEHQLEAERSRTAELQTWHSELQEAFAALRSRFAKARRGRFDETDGSGHSSSIPVDPVKLARMLDLQTAALGRDSSPREVVEAPEQDPLVLSPGVRPDSSDAVRWLISLNEPVVVLVDGYNAQFHIDRTDFTSGAARRHLVDALKRLRAAGSVRHQFVVVYDSTLPGERAGRTSIGGVEVRFAEEERIADEEIVDMAAGLERVVVISSDRAVREGAEADGAVVLWSEAFADWLQRS